MRVLGSNIFFAFEFRRKRIVAILGLQNMFLAAKLGYFAWGCF
jgi:hypothetical protein